MLLPALETVPQSTTWLLLMLRSYIRLPALKWTVAKMWEGSLDKETA